MKSLLRLLPCLALTALAWASSSEVRAAEAKPPAARIDEVFAAYAKPGSPGCALAVIERGKTVYERGYGLANLEHGVPITPRTVFDLGSTSKQFTAAAILLLAKDGKLSLDDDVRKHVPEVPDYGTPITIRHLLHHTSGLRDYIEVMVLGGFQFEDWTTDRDALAALSRQRALNFRPGEEHSYSNSGYFLLSVIAERASGKSLGDFARERIFAPLDMASTEVLNDHTRVVPGRATGYAPREGGFGVAMSNWEQTGDGAVQSTVLDLAKWDQNFYAPKVGGEWLIAELQQTGTLNDGQAFPYARGLAVDKYRGLRRVRHGGAWAGFRAELVRFPEERLSVATLCNLASANPSALAMRVAELYLADRLGPVEAPPPAPAVAAAVTVDASRYAGLYWSEEAGVVRRVVAREGKLFYQRAPGNETELVPLGGETFTMVGAPPGTELVFSTPEAGGGRRLETRSPGAPAMRLEAVEPFAPDAAGLAAFAGAYASDELNTTVRLSVVEGKLRLELERGAPLDLEPVFTDTFRGPDIGLVRFTRDDEQRVSGFEISAGRAQNLRFTRLE